jgi:hypothetical protein
MAEEKLDPKKWESMCSSGHHILDDILDYLETSQDRPIWQHAPHHVTIHLEGYLRLNPTTE